MIRLLTMLALLFSNAAHSASSSPITIWSDGVRLAGDLWLPDGLEKGEKRPAMLLAHGWGGTKAHLNQATRHASRIWATWCSRSITAAGVRATASW